MIERIDKYPSRLRETPEWVERLDPVVYAKQKSSALDYRQVESYKNDGFLIIPSVFSSKEVIEFNQEFEDLGRREDLLSREEFIKEPDSEIVRSVFSVHKFSDVYERLAFDPRIRDKVNYLLDDETYVHQSRINAKPGFKGKEFYWHSDFETWHVEDGMPEMRAISCLITLTENTSYNGSLMLIPGSHNHFISCVGKTPDEHYKGSLQRQEYGVPDHESLTKLYDRYGLHVSVCPPGSVILFDCNTMHGSNSNITPLPRRNIFYVFNAVSNALQQPFADVKPRPNFIAERELEISMDIDT